MVWNCLWNFHMDKNYHMELNKLYDKNDMELYMEFLYGGAPAAARPA